MTIRNLEYLFNPASIAIISDDNAFRNSDAILIRNLMNSGFKGPIMPVMPQRQALQGVLTYKNVSALPIPAELAVITGALAKAPELIAELGARGTRAAILLSDETLQSKKESGEVLRQAILDAAKPHLLRIIGPDALGVASPRHGLNATLSHTPLISGHIALVSQSSAITRSVLDWANSRNIGFSHLVSVGEKIDVDFGDLLDFFTRDNRTRSILLYLEAVRDTRKFMSAARAAGRLKPVVVLKPRNYGDGPVEDAVYEAALARAGVLRAHRIEQLFNAAETVASMKPVYNNRLAILGNSRSIGLLASDALFAAGGRLAQLDEKTHDALARLAPLAPHTDNPVDLGDHADPELYGQALKTLLDDTETDGILVLHAPTTADDALAYAQIVVKSGAGSRRPILTSWVGATTAEPARRYFKDHHIPTYNNPGDAAQAFARTYHYLRYKELLRETPPSIPEGFSPATETARELVETALANGRRQLNACESQAILEAYQIPMVTTRFAADVDQAAAIAADLGGSVALKILSPDITDKSEVGGVAFNLNTPEEVREAATKMLERVHKLAPEALFDGFILQPMVARSGAYETAIGMRTGRHFGPVLFFGHGGTEREVINDIAPALPPLNMQLARELMSRTRIFSTLSTSQARRADMDALALTLIKVSQMAIDLGPLVALDIDPLWASPAGVVALDASMTIAPYQGDPVRRLAIRPYPSELEQDITLPDKRTLLIRPILPEDEPPLQAMVKRLPAEDLRLRFFHPIKELPHDMAARLTQLDYDREMAFIVTERGTPGHTDIWGVVRFTADPDLEQAEYAIIVDRTMTGLGFGPLLMRRIIDYAKQRRIGEIYGEVLRENKSMLKLNSALGFTIKADPEDLGVMRVTLKLN